MINAILIEKTLDQFGIEYEKHVSGYGSHYYTFKRGDGSGYACIRFSNHELPPSYNDKAHRHDADLRRTDGMASLKKAVISLSGKAQKKKALSRNFAWIKSLPADEAAFLKSEINSVGLKAACSIYKIKLTAEEAAAL
jgi:hypothetical protein